MNRRLAIKKKCDEKCIPGYFMQRMNSSDLNNRTYFPSAEQQYQMANYINY